MATIETRYDKINWDELFDEVAKSLNYLRVAWKGTEQHLQPELHQKLVEDLYVPAIKLLAEFCACIKETQEDEQP